VRSVYWGWPGHVPELDADFCWVLRSASLHADTKKALRPQRQ